MHTIIRLCAAVAFSLSLPAAPVLIQNAGFETATLPITYSDATANNLFTGTGSTANWTAIGPTNGTAYGGSFHQVVTGYPGWTNPVPWWGGQNVGYLFNFGSVGPIMLEQVLADVLQNDTTYDLGVLVGRRTFDWGGPGFSYDVQLLAGNTVLASGNALALAVDSSGLHTLHYNSGVGNPLAGQALSIRFVTETNEVFFDNVTLDATANAPEPGSLGAVVAGLGMLVWRIRRR